MRSEAESNDLLLCVRTHQLLGLAIALQRQHDHLVTRSVMGSSHPGPGNASRNHALKGSVKIRATRNHKLCPMGSFGHNSVHRDLLQIQVTVPRCHDFHTMLLYVAE